MASESWVEFYRKQTLRQSLVCRMFIKGALGIHTCGREVKEAGLGRREVRLQRRPNSNLGQHHRKL